MEPTASACLYSETFIGKVSKISFLSPHFKCTVCNGKGKIRIAVIEHCFPNKPLMTHPNITVPIAVIKIIGSGHINCGNACGRPHFIGIFNVSKKSLLTLAVNGTCDKRINSVKALIPVFAAFGFHNVRLIFVLIIHCVTEVTGLLVPSESVKSVFALLDILIVNGDVLILSEVDCNGTHNLTCSDNLRGGKARARILLRFIGYHFNLSRVIIHTRTRVPIIISCEKSVIKLRAS